MCEFYKDCRWFKSDRPCRFHKIDGRACVGCDEYDPLAQNLLVLKFDAAGDVLRSTAILHAIKKAYPKSKVTWYTKRGCADFFLNNSAVDQVLFLEDASAQWVLRGQRFDVVFSLDPSADSASITRSLNVGEIRGFTVDDMGRTIPVNESAREWYEMGLSDALKRANTKTFFEHLHNLAGLPYDASHTPQLVLSNDELTAAERLAAHHGLASDRIRVAVIPGAGYRWRYKRWNESYFAEFLSKHALDNRVQFAVLGGGEDAPVVDSVRSQMRDSSRVIWVGQHSLRDYILLMSQMDIVICSDTLALHVATAFKKQIIAFFGPTSEHEIDLFGRGEKLTANLPCRCCYLPDCRVRPTCMDSIKPDMLDAAFAAALNRVPSSRA